MLAKMPNIGDILSFGLYTQALFIVRSVQGDRFNMNNLKNELHYTHDVIGNAENYINLSSNKLLNILWEEK